MITSWSHRPGWQLSCWQRVGFVVKSILNKHIAYESILADYQHGFQRSKFCETQQIQFNDNMISIPDGARDRGLKHFSTES